MKTSSAEKDKCGIIPLQCFPSLFTALISLERIRSVLVPEESHFTAENQRNNTIQCREMKSNMRQRAGWRVEQGKKRRGVYEKRMGKGRWSFKKNICVCVCARFPLSYFILNKRTGFLIVKENTPPGTYQFQVQVSDGIWPDAVSKTTVYVRELREEAVHNSASLRLTGTDTRTHTPTNRYKHKKSFKKNHAFWSRFGFWFIYPDEHGCGFSLNNLLKSQIVLVLLELFQRNCLRNTTHALLENELVLKTIWIKLSPWKKNTFFFSLWLVKIPFSVASPTEIISGLGFLLQQHILWAASIITWCAEPSLASSTPHPRIKFSLEKWDMAEGFLWFHRYWNRSWRRRKT